MSRGGDGPDDVRPAPLAEALGPLGLLAPAALLAGRTASLVDTFGLTAVLALPVALAAALVLVVAAVLVRGTTDRRRGVASVAVVLVGTVLVTVAGVLLRLDTAGKGLVPALVDRGGTARIEARVAAEPRTIALGWQTVLTVHVVDGVPTRERAVAFLEGPLVLGDRVVLEASARPLPEGGFGRWLGQAHAAAVLDVRSIRRVITAGGWSGASEWVRGRIRTAATRHQGADRGGLLVGFVTGDTRLIPVEGTDAMRATGLSHLTAVSGSNTAIMLAGVAGILALLRVPARVRWAMLALTVIAFAFLTRLEPSVLRAGTMALLVLAAAAAGVARDARHLLAGALLLLVLVDPMLTWSLGLLLSAGATLGVLVVAPAMTERFARRLPRPIAGILGITLGAQVAVAPVLLLSFGTIPWVSVPANLVAVPVAALGAILAFIGSAVALVHLGAASSVFALAGPLAAVVLRVAEAGARLPGGPALPASMVVRGALVMTIVVIPVWLRRSGAGSQGAVLPEILPERK